MLFVGAILKAVEGKGDELEQEFKKLVPKVLKDPGTITYVVHRSIDDPTKFLVYEKYESKDALKAHGATPHFQEFSKAIGPLLDGRPEIVRCSEIAI